MFQIWIFVLNFGNLLILYFIVSFFSFGFEHLSCLKAKKLGERMGRNSCECNQVCHWFWLCSWFLILAITPEHNRITSHKNMKRQQRFTWRLTTLIWQYIWLLYISSLSLSFEKQSKKNNPYHLCLSFYHCTFTLKDPVHHHQNVPVFFLQKKRQLNCLWLGVT